MTKLKLNKATKVAHKQINFSYTKTYMLNMGLLSNVITITRGFTVVKKLDGKLIDSYDSQLAETSEPFTGPA